MDNLLAFINVEELNVFDISNPLSTFVEIS